MEIDKNDRDWTQWTAHPSEQPGFRRICYLYVQRAVPEVKKRYKKVRNEERPIIVCLEKEQIESHIISAVLHRHHPDKHCVNHLPNSGFPIDINYYIKKCQIESMLDGSSYVKFAKDMWSGTIENLSQTSWKSG